MRRSVKVLLGLLAVAVLLICGVLLFTLPRWWIRVGSADAKGQGEAVSVVSIYRSTSADVLFLLPDGDCYVFSSVKNEITIPSCGSQIHNFGIVAFSNESPIPGVPSSDRVKVETDMNNIVITKDVIELTTLSGFRIQAKRDSF